MPLWAQILVLAFAAGVLGFAGWYVSKKPYELRIGWRYLYSGQKDRSMLTGAAVSVGRSLTRSTSDSRASPGR